jgi:selT/selW/selH-like putative selenoprotein
VIVPSRGGVFEVEVDGRLVFSKKATGRHGDYDEILKTIRSGA